MSDYFLNKIYDSVLARKHPKTKSIFRTLSESYGLVYEEEAKVPPVTSEQPKPEQPASTNIVPPKQPTPTVTPNQQEEPADNQKTPAINIDKVVDPMGKWTEAQQTLYKIRPEGVGPGELAVASVLLGTTDEQKCANLVSGSGASYDVSFPSRENPDYKFEVKMIEGKSGTVKIAKHGMITANKIKKDVTEILNTILDQYNNLDEDGKDEVDGLLLNSVSAEVEKELSDYENAMATFLGSNRKLRKQEPEQEQYYRELVSRKEISQERRDRAAELQRLKSGKLWTVKKWCESILQDIGELPFKSILFKSKLKPGYDFLDIKRASVDPEDFGTPNQELFVLFSIEEFVDIINKTLQSEKDVLIPEPTRERRAGLVKTFKQYYGDKEGANTELNNRLDAEATNVDKKLTSLKIQTLKTGYDDFHTFVRELKNSGLTNKITSLKEYINNPETIKGIFPRDVIGLFVVNPVGYHYFPKDQIPNYMKIATLTAGGVKIGYKSPEEKRQ